MQGIANINLTIIFKIIVRTFKNEEN